MRSLLAPPLCLALALSAAPLRADDSRPSAATERSGSPTIASIEALFESVFTPGYVQEVLRSLSPIEVIECEPAGFSSGLALDSFSDLDWDGTDLELSPEGDRARIELTLDGVQLRATSVYSWLLCLQTTDCDTSIELDAVRLTGVGQIRGSPGAVELTFLDSRVSVDGVEIDLELGCDVLLDLLIEGFEEPIADTLGAAFATAVARSLPEVVESVLNP